MGSGSWNSLVLPCSPSLQSSWPERTVEWSFKDTVRGPGGWQQLEGLRNALQDAGCALSEQLTCGAGSPKARSWWVRKQRVEVRQHSASLATLLLFVSANLEYEFPKEKYFPRGPPNWKLSLGPWLLWVSLASEPIGKEDYCTTWGDWSWWSRWEWGAFWFSHFLWGKINIKTTTNSYREETIGTDQKQRSPHQAGNMKWVVEEYL